MGNLATGNKQAAAATTATAAQGTANECYKSMSATCFHHHSNKSNMFHHVGKGVMQKTHSASEVCSATMTCAGKQHKSWLAKRSMRLQLAGTCNLARSTGLRALLLCLLVVNNVPPPMQAESLL